MTVTSNPEKSTLKNVNFLWEVNAFACAGPLDQEPHRELEKLSRSLTTNTALQVGTMGFINRNLMKRPICISSYFFVLTAAMMTSRGN